MSKIKVWDGDSWGDVSYHVGGDIWKSYVEPSGDDTAWDFRAGTEGWTTPAPNTWEAGAGYVLTSAPDAPAGPTASHYLLSPALPTFINYGTYKWRVTFTVAELLDPLGTAAISLSQLVPTPLGVGNTGSHPVGGPYDVSKEYLGYSAPTTFRLHGSSATNITRLIVHTFEITDQNGNLVYTDPGWTPRFWDGTKWNRETS